jgi:hypothetical protein
MISKVLRETIKFGLTGLFIGTLVYTHSDRINNLLNTVRYSFIESEQGYVKKEQALDLKIKYERNGKNNLETYIKTYNQKIPVYERPNGIMIGEPLDLFSNFTEEERADACSGSREKPKKKQVSKADKLKKFLFDVYKNMEDVGDE